MFLGLVGKSCSGKNYVGQLLQERGYEVWDLDVLCHEALTLEENVQAVVKAFGSEVLENGVVCRKTLSRLVFENPAKRFDLEEILYPWLVKKVVSYEGSSVVFLNGALLRRAALDAYCTFIVYVDAPYEDRLKRALSRDGITEQAFEKREEAQGDVDFRENQYKAPILVINNAEGIKNLELIRQINIICDRIEMISNKGNENQ